MPNRTTSSTTNTALRVRAEKYHVVIRCFEQRERSQKIFGARGSAQALEKARFGQENGRKTKPFSLMGLAQAWLDFARACLQLAGERIGIGRRTLCVSEARGIPESANL